MRFRATLLCSLGLLSILGCEKRIPKEELGTVVFEVPPAPVPKPASMPELEGIKDPPEHPPGKLRPTAVNCSLPIFWVEIMVSRPAKTRTSKDFVVSIRGFLLKRRSPGLYW